MIQGQKIWSEDMISDMDFREISGRKIFTFTHMKNNYYEVLQDAASKYPSKIAFYDDRNQPYTYEHFIQMVDNFAEGLNNRGARKHDHIGLLLYNSIEFCVAFYAACKLGAVTVPFPSKYRKQEIQALIEKADLNFLIVSDKFKEWVETYKETITITYSVDEENGYGFRHLSLPDGKRGGATGELDDEVILMFTSGTTSDSKGVVLKNYNVLHATMIYQRLCNITPEDITVIPVPIYHVTGLIALLGVFVYSGGTICLQKKYDARRILECIINNKVTFMHGSPTVFSIMMDLQSEYPSLPSLRMILCGSSYMPVEKLKKLHRWLPKTEIRTVFGMTETASPGTLFESDTPTSSYPSSAGKPVPGIELKILDENGMEADVGTIGSVYIKGTNIAEYYYKKKSPLYTEDGWLNTGDMGYVNTDSYVFFVDRKKDMINRGGEKIWCTDVEEELLSLCQIKEASVVGIPSEKYGEVAAAVVVLEKDVVITEEEIKSKLYTKMAKFKIPERILFLNEIPKTPGMKVDKRYIRTLFKQEMDAC